jgi:hypothetical protein
MHALEEWKELVVALNPAATFSPLYVEARVGLEIVGAYREEGPSYAGRAKVTPGAAAAAAAAGL